MRQICKSDGFSPEMRLSWEVVLMNRNRRRFRVIKNKGSRVIGAEGMDPGSEPERYTFSFQDLLKDFRKNSVIGS